MGRNVVHEVLEMTDIELAGESRLDYTPVKYT
jgi:hypothetical protein